MEKNIYQKLVEARAIIAEAKPTKDGENEYSKFDYFTPEAVEKLVSSACAKVGAVCICDLFADEQGLYQHLKFINLEKLDEVITCVLRTKQASITATNETQQMGGTDTYSERYIKMKFFCIKDNSLDPDATSGKPAKIASSTGEVKTWFDPKNEKHMIALSTYRDLKMSNEDIIKKIRSTEGMGLSNSYADKIRNNEI